MKDVAERSLIMPKRPVRKSDEETSLNPADMKMVGASRKKMSMTVYSIHAEKTYNNLTR